MTRTHALATLALVSFLLAVRRPDAHGEPAAPAAPTDAPATHAAFVSHALSAVRALGVAGRAQLDRAIYDAARTQCRLESGTPAANCLITVARAACADQPERARCEVAADVIAANLRSVSAWIDDATRFRLVRGSADYRVALADELRRRYAPLAAELALPARWFALLG